jgi:hypothetical protein
MNTTLDWDAIEKIARELGVRDRAFEKWKERKSVPHKWRLPIIRASGGHVSLDAFDGALSESVKA